MTLSEHLGRLRACTSFDAASAELLAELARALEPIATPEGAALARGLVHLRSEGAGYRALATKEWIPGQPGHVAPSATAFGLVERRRHAIGVDLAFSRGTDLETGEAVEVPPAYVSEHGSRQRMLAREVTHLVALPLFAPDETVAGMVSLELSWPDRVGRGWPVGDWAASLRLVADVSAPVVLARSVRREPENEGPIDPLLPVLGEKTRPLVRMLRVFVGLDETLLITGPTGAGKSRLAEWCHARSPRSRRSFQTANLLAVPETMQLAELFGWKRGAFTGAHDDHVGLVEAAEGGTLFLDEIDKLSLAAQAALLRLFETRRFSPLGATKERQADVRFVVGTNADLPALVRARAFREDLYYRINVLPVRLPALDERRDEIAGWASVMLSRRHQDAGGRDTAAFEPEALEALTRRSWPGNLRQLENVVRRAYALWLAAQAESPDTRVRIGRSIVEAALASEGAGRRSGDAEDGDALAALARAAELVVDAAIARRDRNEVPIPLATLDVLRAAVLRSAVARLGGAKEAYLLFGADAVVKSRNQGKELKRELDALEELERELRARS
ncbi:MAG: sigma 54-interacting transcriptional regulator [Sandaracinus sp.]